MSEWICIKQQKPKDNQTVLVYMPGIYVEIYKYPIDLVLAKFRVYSIYSCGFVEPVMLFPVKGQERITHWHPIPKAPL